MHSIETGDMHSIETWEIIDEFNENEKERMKFNTNTPGGNNIQGQILLKRNSYFGSLIIEKVNGEEAFQVIHGMPKMDYYNGHNELITPEGESIHVYVKLDGSNILLYPLKDSEGNIIEVVPKTRKTPVAMKEFTRLWGRIPLKEKIEDYIKETGDILIFELYGKDNEHEIKYSEDIAVGLLRGYNKCNKPLGNQRIMELKQELGITAPAPVYDIFYDSSLGSFERVYKECIMNLNETPCDVEGWVMSGIDKNYQFLQLKLKKREYYEKHTMSYGVPRHVIEKEVYKLFDEHIMTMDSLKEHMEEYVSEVSMNLMEEINKDYVEQKATVEKIEDTIFKITAKKTDMELQRLLEKIHEENPALDVVGMLRVFGKEYPFLKRKSNEAYQILTMLSGKMNM